MPSSNRTHSRSGSVAQMDVGDIHVCHICLKQFSRRDLRERHRRRCEKSIGKIIPTKKRSCERCISFKVKCDYEKPSCSRCVGRSVPCEYKLEPKVKMPRNPAFGLGAHTAITGSLDLLSLQEGQSVDFDSHFDAQSSSVTPPEMMFEMSSSSSVGTPTDGVVDAAMNLSSQCAYAGNQYYQYWGQDGAWMDGMLADGSAVDSMWAFATTNTMGSPSTNTYDEQAAMAYATQQGFQQFEYAHGGRCHSKSLSY